MSTGARRGAAEQERFAALERFLKDIDPLLKPGNVTAIHIRDHNIAITTRAAGVYITRDFPFQKAAA